MEKMFIFNHQTWECSSYEIQQDNTDVQEQIEYLCGLLCNNDVIYWGDTPYTHITLPEFICVLKREYSFDLDKVYDKFQKEWKNIILEKYRRLTLLVDE